MPSANGFVFHFPGLRSLAGLALAGCAFGSMASDWQVARKAEGREGINTWVRPVPGLAVKAFKGETEVPYPVWSVVALIADTSGLERWVYQCRSARQVDGRPPEQIYMRFKGIWPAAGRDVLFETQLRQQDNGQITLQSRNVDGMPLDDDLVRIPMLNNTFTLTPLPGRWTRVTFETRVDIGGMVPSWLANMVATDAPWHTLKGMHSRLKDKEGYPHVKGPTDLPAHYLKGRTLQLPEAHLQPSSK